mgnify:CR=1 FL=1
MPSQCLCDVWRAFYRRKIDMIVKSVVENKEKYDTSYEVIRIEYYDAVWDTVIDNKSVKLAIADKSAALSPSDDIQSDEGSC